MNSRSTAMLSAWRTRTSSSGLTRWFSSIHISGEKYSQPLVSTARFGCACRRGTSNGSMSLPADIRTSPVCRASARLWLSGTMRYTISSRYGWPGFQYFSNRLSRIRLPRCHSTNSNAPVPTGCWFAGLLR